MTSANQTKPQPDITRRSHECNIYCRGDVHCGIYYALHPMTSADVALVADGRRFDIVDWREAPEVPPVDPQAPDEGPFPYRYYVWSRGEFRG